ncbi:hypothetical protein M011DRAFT_478178 [Sporormia fimetaria CBS 119925]|uniref:Mitochondrial import inner membrane translocase subunit TIM54 n=1 Tax=Sporormia fimetaria CBS 119925 TaxID=1340428 RepID=A0A6A6VBB2_9PLEO|nr:hypothetical protein M011DRAFT_478178 [Sporormia fimetaria CBS 119925]
MHILNYCALFLPSLVSVVVAEWALERLPMYWFNADPQSEGIQICDDYKFKGTCYYGNVTGDGEGRCTKLHPHFNLYGAKSVKPPKGWRCQMYKKQDYFCSSRDPWGALPLFRESGHPNLEFPYCEDTTSETQRWQWWYHGVGYYKCDKLKSNEFLDCEVNSLPNIRMKLPSRNWLIFLTITGSWTGAVLYDRREKKRIQRKYTALVSHIASEPLDPQQMPRKLSVYISAPPADSLIPARDHFNEYVKPILVAAALDWDAVEGRREGDVRAGLAERIRRFRARRGEKYEGEMQVEASDLLEESRKRNGVRDWDGVPGDIVIGRHTWKEYVRGLHEGWLGPLDAPKAPEEPVVVDAAAVPSPPEAPVAETTTVPALDTAAPSTPTSTTNDASPATPSDDASPTAPTPTPETPKEDEKPSEPAKPKKKTRPPPFNHPSDYPHSPVSPNCPQSLGPIAVLPLPHLLGFLNFPIRMYRFLNRRQVAEEAGRQTVAAVLAAYQPFEGPSESQGGDGRWEQARLYESDEAEWHKSVREKKEGDERKERVWLDEMVLDERIAGRMRKFVLRPEDEERVKTLVPQEEEPWWRAYWPEKKKGAWEGLADEEK